MRIFSLTRPLLALTAGWQLRVRPCSTNPDPPKKLKSRTLRYFPRFQCSTGIYLGALLLGSFRGSAKDNSSDTASVLLFTLIQTPSYYLGDSQLQPEAPIRRNPFHPFPFNKGYTYDYLARHYPV